MIESLNVAEYWRGKNVKIDWYNQDWQWNHYRIENAAFGDQGEAWVMMIGISNEDDDPFIGDYFWIRLSAIATIELYKPE
jgi:hypothetical protein